MNPLPILVSLPLGLISMLVCPQSTPATMTPAPVIAEPVIMTSPPRAEAIMTLAPPTSKCLEGRQPELVVKLARKWSKIFHVPKAWIRSQAYVETQDKLDARNPVTGALGVMQIMPRTYEWLLQSLKRTAFMRNKQVKETLHTFDTGNVNDLMNPDFNIMMASYLMLILKRKFGNDHTIVAAAYDAGHVRIARCLDEGTAFPAQVQEYIARVEAAKRRGYM
jgi:soluble lytic murein transglycosylase-like protein